MAEMIIVRRARRSDADVVLRAVVELLSELGGDPTTIVDNFEATFEQLIHPSSQGGVLVAVESEALHTRTDPYLLGVMTYSIVTSLRTGGPYAIIQEVWTNPIHRAAGVGSRLFDALLQDLPDIVSRIEVGIPSTAFAQLDRTRNFYVRLGFHLIGERLMFARHTDTEWLARDLA